MFQFLKALGYSLGQRQGSEMAGLLKTAFYSSQIYNSLPHIRFALITFTFQIQTVTKQSTSQCWKRVLSAVCTAQLMKRFKVLPLGESCRVSEDVLCCEYEGVKKTNKKQGQYVACTVQENVFSHETYGRASWSPYIVAVMSDFTPGSHSFISQFYWSAPLLTPHSSCLLVPFLFIATEEIPSSYLMLVHVPPLKTKKHH